MKLKLYHLLLFQVYYIYKVKVHYTTCNIFFKITDHELYEQLVSVFLVSSTSVLPTTPLLKDMSSISTQTLSPSTATAHKSSFVQGIKCLCNG